MDLSSVLNHLQKALQQRESLGSQSTDSKQDPNTGEVQLPLLPDMPSIEIGAEQFVRENEEPPGDLATLRLNDNNPIGVVTKPPDSNEITTRNSPFADPSYATASNAQWIAMGESVTVAGFCLPDGLIYYGERLLSLRSPYEFEPALIDHRLPAKRPAPGRKVEAPPSWTTLRYDYLNQEQRGLFLWWLETGRNADVPPFVPLLYYYGLERRFFHDLVGEQSGEEAMVIVAEVQRLAGRYTDDYQLSSALRNFLKATNCLFSEDRTYESDPYDQSLGYSYLGEIEPWLALATAQLLRDERRLPSAWAFAWLRAKEGFWPRTPAERCKSEFRELFEHLYNEKFPKGIKIRRSKKPFVTSIVPASPTFSQRIHVECPLPRVTIGSVNVSGLRQLADEATDALDPLSRWLGRHPDHTGTLFSHLLLPAPLLERMPDVQAFKGWLDKLVGGNKSVWIAYDDLGAYLPADLRNGLGKSDLVMLGKGLENLGFGIEPSGYFASDKLGKGSEALLYRLPNLATGDDNLDLPLTALALLARVSTWVAPDRALEIMQGILPGNCTPRDLALLEARLLWWQKNAPQLHSLRKRLDSYSTDLKSEIANLLLVAVAESGVQAEAVQGLRRIYPLLGKDEDLVFSNLHDVATRVGPGKKASTRPVSRTESSVKLGIDSAQLASKRQESQHVAHLLDQVFRDEEVAKQEDEYPTGNNVSTENASLRLPLALAKLLRQLAATSPVSRSEFERLAKANGLMPNGALEALNDAAFELCDEPVIEGDDQLTVIESVYKELLP